MTTLTILNVILILISMVLISFKVNRKSPQIWGIRIFTRTLLIVGLFAMLFNSGTAETGDYIFHSFLDIFFIGDIVLSLINIGFDRWTFNQ